jgi:hypothetical protein
MLAVCGPLSLASTPALRRKVNMYENLFGIRPARRLCYPTPESGRRKVRLRRLTLHVPVWLSPVCDK